MQCQRASSGLLGGVKGEEQRASDGDEPEASQRWEDEAPLLDMAGSAFFFVMRFKMRTHRY